MKAVALHAVLADVPRQRNRSATAGCVAVKAGVEAGDLRDVRASRSATASMAARLYG